MKKNVLLILALIVSIGMFIGLLVFTGLIKFDKKFDPNDYTQEELDEMNEQGMEQLKQVFDSVKQYQQEKDEKVQNLTDEQNKILQQYRGEHVQLVIEGDAVDALYDVMADATFCENQIIKKLNNLDENSRFVSGLIELVKLEKKYASYRNIILIDQDLNSLRQRFDDVKNKCAEYGYEIDLTKVK